ncbi:MAG: hypothetical protein GY805_02935 [Chloroflexi bacterium]|nr:hypothetical protein [Chloroflexota bacterium]
MRTENECPSSQRTGKLIVVYPTLSPPKQKNIIGRFRPMQENSDPTTSLFWHWLEALSKKQDISIFEKALVKLNNQ